MKLKMEVKMSKEVTTKGTNSLSRKSTSKKSVETSSAPGRLAIDAIAKFVSAKTGRIVKSSPVEPRLGKKRIQAAVRDYVRRDARSGKISG